MDAVLQYFVVWNVFYDLEWFSNLLLILKTCQRERIESHIAIYFRVIRVLINCEHKRIFDFDFENWCNNFWKFLWIIYTATCTKKISCRNTLQIHYVTANFNRLLTSQQTTSTWISQIQVTTWNARPISKMIAMAVVTNYFLQTCLFCTS